MKLTNLSTVLGLGMLFVLTSAVQSKTAQAAAATCPPPTVINMTCPAAPPTPAAVGSAPSSINYPTFSAASPYGGCNGGSTPPPGYMCKFGTTRMQLIDNNGNITTACGDVAVACPSGYLQMDRQVHQFTIYKCSQC